MLKSNNKTQVWQFSFWAQLVSGWLWRRNGTALFFFVWQKMFQFSFVWRCWSQIPQFNIVTHTRSSCGLRFGVRTGAWGTLSSLFLAGGRGSTGRPPHSSFREDIAGRKMCVTVLLCLWSDSDTVIFLILRTLAVLVRWNSWYADNPDKPIVQNHIGMAPNTPII